MSFIPSPALTDALRAAGVPFEENRPLSGLTTFRIGGPARLCLFPRSREEMIAALDAVRAFGGGAPFCVLGRGSNVLCDDEGFDGIVLVTTDVKSVDYSPVTDGVCTVRADCGASLTALAADCVRDGRALSGLAFAYGIPGSVGGAAVMNAGAYGGEMAQVIAETTYYDMETGVVSALSGDAHGFSYRHSVYADHPARVILDVTLTLPAGDAEAVRAEMKKNMDARREKQPLEYPSAGSVFKRPAAPDVYVGRMVEDCGLKGASVGGAQVSEKHAGFIVNRGGATASDVRALIDRVRSTVREKCGYELECEIRRVGTK